MLTFLMLLVLAGLAAAAGTFCYNSQLIGKSQLMDKQAVYIAEAGWQRARQALVAKTWSAASSPGNSYTESLSAGEYVVAIVDNGGGTYTITSSGYVPSQAVAAAKRQMVESSVTVTLTNGTNLSLSATASASSSNAGNTPNKANDGNSGTKWQAGTDGPGSWLAMDYSSATILDKIIVQEKKNIDGVSIEWSDDASSWTTASGLSVVESPSQTWTATFTAASHRYFRASFTDVPSKKSAEVSEMESYNQAMTLGTGTVTTQW